MGKLIHFPYLFKILTVLPSFHTFKKLSQVQYTMWKVQDISVSQILREINNGESRSYNTALFVILGALNFVNFVNLTLSNSAKIQKPLNVSK